MKKRKSCGRAAASPASTAKDGSAANHGVEPVDSKHQVGKKRKFPPVTIEVALDKVRDPAPPSSPGGPLHFHHVNNNND